MRLGYVRVSVPEQHTEQLETALHDAGCVRVLID